MSDSVSFYVFTHASSLAEAVSSVEKHHQGLKRVLLGEGRKGVLIVYVSPSHAWKRMVNFVSRSHSGLYGRNIHKLDQRNQEMKEEYEFLKDLDNQCNNVTEKLEMTHPDFCEEVVSPHGDTIALLHRVRFLSPFAFVDVLDRIKSRQRDNFIYWFEQTTYDVPKLADAMIRLRNSKTPTFRFDIDVLFSDDSLNDKMNSVEISVRRSLEFYEVRRRDPVAQTWYFSGQYDFSPLETTEGRKSWPAWNRAFSTRASPALIATEALCNSEQFTNANGWTPSEQTLNEAVSEELMLSFYGIRVDHDGKLTCEAVTGDVEKDILNLGNGFIGANPMTACVSGSALCVSSGLTLDLPPFSNSRLNIMWIDDDLMVRIAERIKKTPDRDYGDLSKPYGTGNPVKARTPPGNVVWYTLEIYLPTLVYGCIVDAWVTQGVCPYASKFRHDSNPEPGPFIAAVHEVITRGREIEKDRVIMYRNLLVQRALERLKEVYWQWLKLFNQDGRTLASLWATGTVSEVSSLKQFCSLDADHEQLGKACRTLVLGNGMVRREWHNKAKLAENFASLPKLESGDLNPHFAKAALMDLVEDAINYLEWVIVWPSVVQAVRSTPDGQSHLDPVVVTRC